MRLNFLQDAHGREKIPMGPWRMWKNIDALCMEEEINEDGQEIGEVHWDVCSLEKDKVLYNMNDEKLEPMEMKCYAMVSKRS